VRCGHNDIELSTVSAILSAPQRRYAIGAETTIDMPFINARWRARVRVVDFYPNKLEDFSRPVEGLTQSEMDGREDLDPDSKVNNWEWAFYLLVEDAKVSKGEDPAKLSLLVSNSAAQGLLKMDASE
jgi:protection of telomeres protein 1